MYVTAVRMMFYLNYLKNLKEKRSILRSLIAKCKRNFQISLSELQSNNDYRYIDIGFCIVSNEQKISEKIADQMISDIENNLNALLVSVNKENINLSYL